MVPEMRREYGGCAGNIAYNLMLLGGEPLIMATVGDDAGAYLERLDRLALPRTHVRHVPGSFTAQAFITTDLDDNQITAFHPGAMNFAHEASVPVDRGIRIGIVAPDGREAMTGHAAQFAAKKIPFIFDPGQGLPRRLLADHVFGGPPGDPCHLDGADLAPPLGFRCPHQPGQGAGFGVYISADGAAGELDGDHHGGMMARGRWRREGPRFVTQSDIFRPSDGPDQVPEFALERAANTSSSRNGFPMVLVRRNTSRA
jgi:hypothetical protein